jgi:hypothetical protein
MCRMASLAVLDFQTVEAREEPRQVEAVVGA